MVTVFIFRNPSRRPAVFTRNLLRYGDKLTRSCFSGDMWQKECRKISLKKGAAIPLQAWTGPEGSRRLRLPDFMTIGT